MGYYNGSIIIHNETAQEYTDALKECNHVARMKFTVSFNKNKLYLDNKMIQQLLNSNAVQDFILRECAEYIDSNHTAINNALRKRFVTAEPSVKIKVIGKLLIFDFYGCVLNNAEDFKSALKRRLKKEKNYIEMLKGE